MFSLLQSKALLVHVNNRAENHGPEHVLALDLSLAIDIGNDQLKEFHPKLKDSFYHFDKQVDGDLVDQGKSGDADYKPHLIFGCFSPFSIDHKLVGARVVIHAPISLQDITFEGARVDDFSLDMKQGGTVRVTCKARVKPNKGDDRTVGRVCAMMKDEISISIIPPDPDLVSRAEDEGGED